jgi:hypothetical protein
MHSSNSAKCLESSMMRPLSSSTRRHIQYQEPSGSSLQTAAISQPIGLLASSSKIKHWRPAREHRAPALELLDDQSPNQNTLEAASTPDLHATGRCADAGKSKSHFAARPLLLPSTIQIVPETQQEWSRQQHRRAKTNARRYIGTAIGRQRMFFLASWLPFGIKRADPAS